MSTSNTTSNNVEEFARKAIEVLYGKDGKEVKDFKIREMLPYSTGQIVAQGGLPSEDKRDAWDVQLTFLQNNVQYTVDLLVHDRDGQIVNARLIDKMNPI
jgi:hypothetical protein